MNYAPNMKSGAHSERVAHTEKHPAPGVLVKLLESTGVTFNGDSPWDIQIHDQEVYRRILSQGSLGFGEAYVEGLWDCQRLDEMFSRLLRVDIDRKIHGMLRLRLLFSAVENYFLHKYVNLQSKRHAYDVALRHYDIGSDVYETMLDSGMNYSCGYWPTATTLEQAQYDKLDLVCKKLELKSGEKVLDIGCGWGGFARFAAEHYGVEVTGITISKAQCQLARDRCRDLPVDIRLMDYRNLQGTFDKVVSIGMFEHVGAKNYQHYFRVVERVMAPEGLFLLHTIGDYSTANVTDPWINKYIFPNGQLPSAARIAKVIEPDLIIRDWHNFAADYDRTLAAWWSNFNNAWPELKNHYDQHFYRMWKYYLHSCMGLFRSGQGQLWQIVFSRRGARPDYRSLR